MKDPHWYAVQVSDTTMLIKEPAARTINILKRHQQTAKIRRTFAGVDNYFRFAFSQAACWLLAKKRPIPMMTA